MKAMWSIAAALLLVAATTMDTSAKGGGGKHGKHGKHKGSLIEQLGLSEDQQAQVQTLKEDIHAQRQTLGEQYRTDFDAILTAEQRTTLAGIENPLGLSADQQAQIRALKEQDLTKEQYRTSFDAILTAEQRTALEALKAERGRHKVSLTDQLGLSADQQAQVQTLKETLREQKQALGEQYRTSFDAILTAEQRTKLAAIKAKRGSYAKGGKTGGAGKATTSVEQTSWGHIKDSFGQ